MSTDPQTQALALRREQAITVRDFLVQRKAELQAALPAQLTADRFLRIALNSMQKNPTLFECTKESLYRSIMQAATLGLEPDDGRGLGYLIPRKIHGKLEAQFQPGYRGLIDLARRSKDIDVVEAAVVYDAEPFRMVRGAASVLDHSPLPPLLRGKTIIGAYATAWYRGASRCQWEFLWTEEIEARRHRSAAPNSPAWTNDFAAMCKKTALLALAKLLPANPELARAVEADEEADLGVTRPAASESILDLEIPPAGPPEAPPAAAAPKAPRKSKAPEPAPEPENGPEPELSEADAPAAPPPAPAPEPPPAATPPAATPAPMAVTTEQMGTLFALARKLNGEKGAGSAIALLGKVTGKQSAAKLTAAEADAAITAFEEALGA